MPRAAPVFLMLSLFAAHASPARSASAPVRPTAPAALRWTDETPDTMVDDAVTRALAPRTSTRSALAALTVIATLSDRATEGHAERALEQIATQATLPAEVRQEAALLGRMLAADENTDAGLEANEKLGVIDQLSILGPFRDTGGGLDAHDGPESDRDGFGNLRARYSWGSYDVSWRVVPRVFAPAEGAPLDLFVFPRKESCSWVATKLIVASTRKIVVHLASTGQARLVLDGVDLGRDDTVAASLRFDRLVARVSVEPGAHLLAAKVCSGALDDEGRVRLRVTDEAGAAPAGVVASAQLGGLPSFPTRGGKLAFEHLSAPLARALAEPTADIEGQLEAALVRTQAGADDLRSPRAPGILAAMVDRTSDAELLAMAAWLVPSGANKSAWLNRARAAASSDPRTRAFVDRRTIERHIEAGLADWAKATLTGSGVDRAPDAEAVLLSAQVDAALGSDALRLLAMRRLRAYAQAAPDAPDAVLQALASVARSFDPKVALEARERLAKRGEVGAARVEAAEAIGRDAVVAAARRALAGGVSDADDALSIAGAVARAGAHEEARAVFGQLGRWAPNRASVWAGLADEIGTAAGDANRDGAIAAALRRARELDPGEARYRAELALRATNHASGEARDDEHYLVASDVILARRQGPRAGSPIADNAVGVRTAPRGSAAGKALATDLTSGTPEPEPPDVADRELHWLRAVVMHPDRRVSELVHYAREIVIAPRTEDELYEEAPAEGDVTEIVRARVHRRDGGTAFPVEQLSDSARPRIRWPELAPGDVVEVAFRSWTAGPVGGRGDPPFFRLDYAGAVSTHPVLYNEVDVESPKDQPIYADVVHGGAERREETDEGGRHIVRLVWDRPFNVADEPLAPPLSEVIPTVVLSTFKDWSAFRAWYAEAVRGFTEPDAQVRDLAAQLTRGQSSREGKLRAVFDFVADDIRYVNYVSGEWWLPNRPQQLLARREGDCDDKALLLITLLKAVGIDAQEVLVQTRLTNEPSLLRAHGAAVPVFDHGIAFLPGANGGTYLDATSPQSRLGPLPSMDARAVALRMDGPPEIVQLPSSAPEDHGVDSKWTVALRADGSADLQGEEHATGDDAFWMRTNMTEPGARPAWLEERMIGQYFPTIEVDKKVEFRGDLPQGGAVAQWRARSNGLGRHEGAELVVPLSPAQPSASQLAPLVHRTLPVWLPAHVAPRRESRTIRVVAPPGFSFETLPTGGDENAGPFGRAHLDVSHDPSDPRAIIVRRSVVFDQSTIPVDEYAKWRAWIQRVDALMHQSVRLVPSAGGAR